MISVSTIQPPSGTLQKEAPNPAASPTAPRAARRFTPNAYAENAMRSIALGRKNYLFAGSDLGGERAAAMYSILQSAKLNELNPETYLRSTLDRIANGH